MPTTIATQDKNDVELAKQARQLRAAFAAVQRHYDSQQGGAAFNGYFTVAPTGRFNLPLNGDPHNSLSEVIKHGFIVTCPNVPDNLLPPEAIAARDIAVAIGLNAAQAIEPTHAEMLSHQGNAALTGPG
jgi:hypothetical protein